MKDKTVYLATALECIGLIQDYICGYTLEAFLEDRKTQDAVIRNLEVIGQALKDYGLTELAEVDHKTPWSKIAGLRNILAHEYLGVDQVLLWETVDKYLDSLRQSLEKIQSGP